MNKKLQRIYDRLERSKEELLKDLAEIPEEKLNARNRSDGWSINQILFHLQEAEKFSVLYMQKKSNGIITLENSGLKESLKSMMLTLSQRVPFLKYKAPRVIPEPPFENLSLDNILIQWNNVRLDLKELLDHIEEKDIRKKIYKHPIAGYLNAPQGVDFLREHLLHHLPQIKRLMR